MDADDDFELRLARTQRRRRWVLRSVLGLLALGAISPCALVTWRFAGELQRSSAEHERHSQHATPRQIAEVDALTRQLEGSLELRATPWRAAMADVSRLVPRPELGPCPVRLPLRAPASAQRGFSVNNLDSFDVLALPGRQVIPHVVVHGATTPGEPPRVARAREHAAELRASIRRPASRETLAGYVRSARALATPAFWTYDVVLRTRTWRPPRADALGASFSPGAVSGTAYLFDYGSGTVLCAGEVNAESTSDSVSYRAQVLREATALQQMLDTELAAEVERGIARGVRFRAGPAASESDTPEPD